jgi:Phasin protein
METKGRRGPRATRPMGAPAEPAMPVEAPAVGEQLPDAPIEPEKSTETSGETAKPEEAAPDIAAAAITPAPLPDTAARAAEISPPEDLAQFGRDAFAALTQSQAALARGIEALSVEMAGIALSGIDTATRTATKMLGVKTLSDAIDVNTGFTCSSLDTLVGSSAKLSELGVKLAAETYQPFLTQFGKGWIKASRLRS